MGRSGVWLLIWLSGFCAALAVAAIFWGAMMIDIPAGVVFVLIGQGSLVASIVLGVWGLRKGRRAS